MESNEKLERRLHPQLWPQVKHCVTNENLLLHGGLVSVKNLHSRYARIRIVLARVLNKEYEIVCCKQTSCSHHYCYY